MAKKVVTAETTGSFQHILRFFDRTRKMDVQKILEKYGRIGVRLLSDATPVNTGETASSWSYEIVVKRNESSLIFKNAAKVGNSPIVLLIKYGHATGNGGYVQPNDFISPVIKGEFDDMVDTIWKEVTYS